tara:strand:- start:333 stop:518 length:186 start_codon:yes stop_codon:yes gene_type:complete
MVFLPQRLKILCFRPSLLLLVERVVMERGLLLPTVGQVVVEDQDTLFWNPVAQAMRAVIVL